MVLNIWTFIFDLKKWFQFTAYNQQSDTQWVMFELKLPLLNEKDEMTE